MLYSHLFHINTSYEFPETAGIAGLTVPTVCPYYRDYTPVTNTGRSCLQPFCHPVEGASILCSYWSLCAPSVLVMSDHYCIWLLSLKATRSWWCIDSIICRQFGLIFYNPQIKYVYKQYVVITINKYEGGIIISSLFFNLRCCVYTTTTCFNYIVMD